ncbi:MAG: hypothetical protein V5A57_01230 [Candidatus Paceibacterota bacterium]
MSTKTNSKSDVEIIKELGPHIIGSDEEGKKEDGLAKLMFLDPHYVKQQLDIRENRITKHGERNEIHRYLRALLRRAEKLRPQKLCPYCGVELVEYFVVNDQSVDSLGPYNTSCSHASLRGGCGLKMISGNAPSMAYIDEFELKFAALRKLQNKHWIDTEYKFKKVIELFEWAFDLDELTNKSAYELFSGRRS